MTPVDMGTGRHAANHAPTAHALWHCPACGAEQTTRLELGCEKCGSGKPGAKIADPLTPRVTFSDPPPVPTGNIEQAFLEWIRPMRGQHEPTVETLMFEAFKAGALFGSAQASPTLVGSAESRTILAALTFFLENVLSLAPEEVKTGEWLSAEQTKALIKKLERTM